MHLPDEMPALLRADKSYCPQARAEMPASPSYICTHRRRPLRPQAICRSRSPSTQMPLPSRDPSSRCVPPSRCVPLPKSTKRPLNHVISLTCRMYVPTHSAPRNCTLLQPCHTATRLQSMASMTTTRRQFLSKTRSTRQVYAPGHRPNADPFRFQSLICHAPHYPP